MKKNEMDILSVIEFVKTGMKYPDGSHHITMIEINLHEPEQSRWLDPVTSANVKIGAYRRPQRHASCKRNEIFSLLDEAGNWRAYSGRT